MKEPRDIMQLIIDKMPSSPRFYSEDWQGVANTMSTLGLNKANDGTHYPLFVLDTNYIQDQGETIGIDSEFNGKLYIIDRTKANYTGKQRDDLSYQANIIPLLNEFMFYMFRSTLVSFDIEPFPKAHINSLGEYDVFMPFNTDKLPFLKGKDSKQNKLNCFSDASGCSGL